MRLSNKSEKSMHSKVVFGGAINTTNEQNKHRKHNL
uniref:Uncharacterized protein n=1 Tax=Rhizophora mucronata TaxID=61149 RepID=A0A2P2L968_RHIMU